MEPTLPLPVLVADVSELVSARGAILLAGDRPARAMRVARAIGAVVPERQPASRRKLLAAFAVTAVLAATVAGLTVVDD